MPLPTTTRIPFFSVEFDPTRAAQGPAILQYQVLLIGQRTTAGTVAALVKKRVQTEEQARAWFGEGSQLHLMVRAFLLNCKHVPLYAIALDDHGSGVQATKTITITGPATADGSMYCYIGGKRITASVANGDVQNNIATALRTAINATPDLPVTSSVSTNVITLTARNDGEPGNDIDVRFNYNEGEAFPTGVSAAVATGVTGATNPDVTAALDAIGEEWFQVICAPYKDATNLTIIEDELESRFGYERMIDGQYICSPDGANYSAIQTFGAGRNSPYVRAAHSYGIPWTSFEYAAAWAAVEAASAQSDPAKPQFNQVIKGALAPAVADRFTPSENNSLLFDGISTFYVVGGKVTIQRAITMYQTNAAGAADTAYLRAETMYTLLYLRYSFREWFLSRFPRAKLANDGAFVPPGQSYITPGIARTEAVAWARAMERKGLIENIDQFKNDLVVIRNPEDPDRLDFVLPPDLVNQFVVGAAQMQFLLQAT